MFDKITDLKILSSISHLPNREIYINEADYGLRYIKPYIQELTDNASVLEIGPGPCVLLSHLSATYKSRSFTGIEPIGPGFENFKASLSQLKKIFDFELYEGTYEQFSKYRSEKYDLIFLINVFEHLPNWQNFIKFVRFHLKDSGKCIILCPNYTFPYEPHFKIPIIINKKLTYNIFRKRIEGFEIAHSLVGLWSSLNFAKLRQVQKVIADQNLTLRRNDRITVDLINRLSYDKEFEKRQKVVGKIAKVLNMFGIFNLLKIYPFYLFQPYIFLEIKHRSLP